MGGDVALKLHASGEDYLEAVLILQRQNGMVRSVDLARHMGYAKPSISHAVAVLRKGGYLITDTDGYLHLTNDGRGIAEAIFERHQFFTNQLIDAGIDPAIAEEEACRMEHAISDETFQKLKGHLLKKAEDKGT